MFLMSYDVFESWSDNKTNILGTLKKQNQKVRSLWQIVGGAPITSNDT